MSRRNALAAVASLATAETAVVLAAPKISRQPDAVMVAADRCRRASEAIERNGYFDEVRQSPAAEHAFNEHRELVCQMVETPAASIAGICAKLREVFECELNELEPDLNAWTLQYVMDDLKRLGSIA